jgi:hypothetical protein
MNGSAMPRRTFVRLVAGAALLGVAVARRPPAVRAWWSDIWSHRPGARGLGLACADVLGPGHDPAVLAASIEAGVPEVVLPSRAARRAALAARVRADFAEGRTLWVDGWLLADTEARLYALTAITTSV